jgi:hypothetical protein
MNARPLNETSWRWVRTHLAWVTCPHGRGVLEEEESYRMERALYEDRIRACGNGVHPGQAALAWHLLWGALTSDA